MDKKNKRIGVTHPIPTKYAERIYNENKTVFVGKKHLGKVSKGDKFIIYESQGAMAYTGMGEILFIGKMSPSSIIRKYKSKLIVSAKEFKEYSKNEKLMNVILFKNFEKFKTPVKPNKFITMGGKYIWDNEYDMILKNKD